MTKSSAPRRHGKYRINHYIECIDAFITPDGGVWMPCPFCKLRPKVWEFDNGRFTACGCWNSRYRHPSVRAESIWSVHKRTSGKIGGVYDSDGLRKNWNHWCHTGKKLFKAGGGRW